MDPKKLIGKSLYLVGIILIVLGIIFTLQSKSVVGPSSSFMYSNPAWTINGFIVVGLGITACILGIIRGRLTGR
jgi:hypothetical protein